MRRLSSIVALALAAGAWSGCDKDSQSVYAKSDGGPDFRETADAKGREAGKSLASYAPATDFSGASPEDASGQASAMFDGAVSRGAVSGRGGVLGASRGGGSGKRVSFTAASSERITDLRGAVPPLPDDYDYSRSGATPGSARDAGQTILGFATFQIAQKFPTVAPIMSRLGWRAAPRDGSNEEHSPYRVTVHHTQGVRPMNETETEIGRASCRERV